MNSIPPFILASSSPRRKQLLEEAGFTFEVVSYNTDESFDERMNPIDVVEFLAKKKLLAAHNWLQKRLVITADTLVFKDNKILGKPQDRKDAVDMLRFLSNGQHEVVTSVCIGYQNHLEQFSVNTKVQFDKLKKEEIEHYVDQYLPFDKAGSYGIQEWIGLIGIAKIDGSYTNVVGLPLNETYRAIIDFSRKWIH